MKESKKAKAFALFSQGCVPSSPEIKDLRLHSSSRYKYFNEWEKLGKPSTTTHRDKPSTVSSATPSGEIIGAIDETKNKSVAQAPKAIEEPTQEEPVPEPEPEPELWPEDIRAEEAARAAKAAKVPGESIGVVSEVVAPKTKDGKVVEPEQKIATTVAEDGIKCTVLLSLQTLTLYSIAKSTQAQYSENGDEELSMGDFLDTCAEDFFSVRGKKLGLINLGGKK